MAQVVAPAGKIMPPRLTMQLQRSFLLFAKLRFLTDNNDTKDQEEENGAELSRNKKKKRLLSDDSDDDDTIPLLASNVPGVQSFDVTLCDLNKMMTHILDCVAALYEVQEELQHLESQEDQQDAKKNETEQSKREAERTKKNVTGHALNKTFQFALSRLAGRLKCGVPITDSNEKKEAATTVTDVSCLYPAFPDDSKLYDNRGWLPLHWAVASGRTLSPPPSAPPYSNLNLNPNPNSHHNMNDPNPAASEDVSEDEVKRIYVSDPMALLRHHQEGAGPSCKAADLGFTPVHLLCMLQTPSAKRNMQLLRYFSQYEGAFLSVPYQYCLSHPLPNLLYRNLGAFRIAASDSNRGDPSLYGFSALHVACSYGQPTEELLRMLLQFDIAQTKMREHQLPKKGHTPLGRLCRRGLSTALVKCLLDVDNSVQVASHIPSSSMCTTP